MRGLKLYEVNPNYIKYLAQYQEHIFISDADKARRKYIGVLLQINDIKYFAPLSSFKAKHKKMKESVDFIKIHNYAVININNMIPVCFFIIFLFAYYRCHLFILAHILSHIFYLNP